MACHTPSIADRSIHFILTEHLGCVDAIPHSSDSMSIQPCSSQTVVKEEVERNNGNVGSTALFTRNVYYTLFSCMQIALLRIHSGNPYMYGLNLLHSMFTQEKLAGSLLFKSKKSGCSKPELDPVRVEKLIGK